MQIKPPHGSQKPYRSSPYLAAFLIKSRGLSISPHALFFRLALFSEEII
jgi:hypothetical protein